MKRNIYARYGAAGVLVFAGAASAQAPAQDNTASPVATRRKSRRLSSRVRCCAACPRLARRSCRSESNRSLQRARTRPRNCSRACRKRRRSTRVPSCPRSVRRKSRSIARTCVICRAHRAAVRRRSSSSTDTGCRAWAFVRPCRILTPSRPARSSESRSCSTAALLYMVRMQSAE